MTFVSLTFFIFFAFALLLYYIFPLNCRWLVLLGASLCFYAFAGVEKLAFVFATALIVYFSTRQMEKIYATEEPLPEKKRKAKKHLILGIALTLAQLLYVKVGGLLAASGDGVLTRIIVPLGISYYTFSVVGYMADVYWRKTTVERNFLHLLLYMIYFPQIIQGPIPRHKRLAHQLKEGHRFDYRNFCFGLQRMAWGYFKKMVIADRFVVIVTEVFSNYEKYDGLYFVVAVLASVVQLYCDFSACMDIALGASQCVSIALDENFDHPFASRSCGEFWRRWHITLGTWFKDYIYMPVVINPRLIKFSQLVKPVLGVRFSKSLLTIVPTFAVWLLTGLWHGTGYNFILWGLYWFVFITVSTIFAPEIKKVNQKLHIDTESNWWHLIRQMRTFLVFCGSRLLTAPADIEVSWEVAKRMFATFNPWILFDKSLYKLGLDQKDFWVGILSLMLLWCISRMQCRGVKIRESVAGAPLVIRWALYYALILTILIFGMYGSGQVPVSFVYANY